MAFVDFNSLIICNDNYDAESLTAAIKYFRALGVKNFIVTYSVYPERISQSELINNFKSAKLRLTSSTPRTTRLRVYPNVHVSHGILRNPFINRLRVRGDNLIFVELPLFAGDDWINSDINYLLFKQKLFPVFISFECNLISSPKAFTQTLYKSSNAAFALDLEFIVSSDYEHFLHKAMTTNTLIIPCISRELKAYSDIILQFEHMKDRMGNQAYLKLCRHIDISCKRVFTGF